MLYIWWMRLYCRRSEFEFNETVPFSIPIAPFNHLNLLLLVNHCILHSIHLYLLSQVKPPFLRYSFHNHLYLHLQVLFGLHWYRNRSNRVRLPVVKQLIGYLCWWKDSSHWNLPKWREWPWFRSSEGLSHGWWRVELETVWLDHQGRRWWLSLR